MLYSRIQYSAEIRLLDYTAVFFSESDYPSIALLFFKPPPPVGAGGGYMFSGRPSVPLSVRASVRASVRDSHGSFMFRDISSIC